MNRLFFSFLCCFVAIPFVHFAQDPVEKGISFLLVNQLEGDEFEEGKIVQELEDYLEKPLRINEAKWEELLEFPFFNLIHIHHLRAYRKKKGAFRSKKEMHLLPQFTNELIEVIQPFISYKIRDEKKYLRNSKQVLHTKIIHRFVPLLHLQDSTKKPQLAWWNRVEIKNVFQNTDFSLSQEKDAGERYFYPDNSTEFAAINLHYCNPSRFVKRAVLGAYQLTLGEGLVMKTGFNGAKLKFNYGNASYQSKYIKPHASSSELAYLNGAIAVLGKNKSTYTCFVSQRKLDAKLETDSLGKTIETTLYQTGKHETLTEVMHRNKLKSNTIGHQLSHDWGTASLSFNQVLNVFNYALKPKLNYYNQHRFSGKTSLAQSVSWKKVHSGQLLHGELAMDAQFKKAFLLGVSGTLFQSVNYGLLYRNFGVAYQSFHGQSFQQQTNLGNEKGLAIRFDTALSDRWFAFLFVDQYRFPYMKYLTQFSSCGYERKIRLEYRSKVQLNLQYKVKMNEKSVVLHEETRSYFKQKKHSLSVQSVFLLTEKWHYKLGVTATLVTDTSSHKKGVLCFQDVQYHDGKYTVNFRTTVYSVNDFSARIYLYENGLLYSNPFKMFTGKGFSTYLNWKLRVAKEVSVSAKISYSRQFEKELVSNRVFKVNAGFQVQYQF